MTAADLARRLLRKADQDRYTAQVLASDPDTADEAIGFHAQQAVEKSLKAVLAGKSIPFRQTHNLGQLVAALRARGVDFPVEFEGVFDLGPFAVALRYDDLALEDAEPFDREWALSCIDRVQAWARAALATAADGT